MGSWGEVAGLVALGTLERTSSILAHFSWGFLVVVAAASGRRRYLAAAAPMGLVDFRVPFALSLGPVEFETLVFALSLVALLVSHGLTRTEWRSIWARAGGAAPGSPIWP